MIKSAALTVSFEVGDQVSTYTFAGYALSKPTGNKEMFWNYRVVYIPESENDIFSEANFTIREVFYDKDGEIHYWTDEGAVPTGADFEELCNDFDLMAEAFERPILMLTTDEDGVESLVELEDEESEEESENQESKDE
jgi:hypothetical protein